ncbi:hypothetical protein E3N88_00824 [Mikania micrantha]|uniref:Uncharacterized protein n=1 Tax=Mikania micrantha TaxID=192012 RepID=A0A5N6Q1I9_9ASTR|nr:hypothetical protein E3N88_00824 [Mikania micrantha]
MPAGAGFSYAETQEGWVSSDTILAANYKDFIKKFLSDNPKLLGNPLYISGISYSAIIVPKVTLELYEGNERGDQPAVNIQGYILCSPLTNKFMDFNSRLEYAHRMALISDDIYQSAINNCNGNYLDTMRANSACRESLQGYEKCTSLISLDNILEPVSDDSKYAKVITATDKWANMEVVQQALNVHQGMVGKFEEINYTLLYNQGKNDTICYAYDIFSSYSYHKKLSTKSCRALIFSGDHDFTFPYVGVEQWIASLNLEVEAPWKPFYVDNQVGGYLTKYALNNYSLTYATVKGAGHVVEIYKPKESFDGSAVDPESEFGQKRVTRGRDGLARQAPFCLCTRGPISVRPEETFARLRYLLGGLRPIETVYLRLSLGPKGPKPIPGNSEAS